MPIKYRNMTSLYDITIPTLIKVLRTENSLLEKAEAFAIENGIPISDLLLARLREDMFPLTKQIGVTAMLTNKILQRITGQELPAVELKENLTLEECHSLINKTLDILAEIKPEEVNGKEYEIAQANLSPTRVTNAKTIEYVLRFGIPSVYFHFTTMYGILRMKGVPLAKIDYLTYFVDGLF
ncbi:hypothetical protein F5B20DRAFT_566527 [Whalleya microplaca]|nr:hypothetical protein F5B20DRAFT_566527 [Whalleya microplaca]